jgi:hypothetical protein
VAHHEAVDWFGQTALVPTALSKLLESWEQRFKLVDIG